MRIGFSQRRTAAYLHVWAALLAGYAILLRFVPPRPGGHWDLGNTLIAAVLRPGRGRRLGLDGLLARDPQGPPPAGSASAAWQAPTTCPKTNATTKKRSSESSGTRPSVAASRSDALGRDAQGSASRQQVGAGRACTRRS